jgi:hypothetical protein
VLIEQGKFPMWRRGVWGIFEWKRKKALKVESLIFNGAESRKLISFKINKLFFIFVKNGSDVNNF